MVLARGYQPRTAALILYGVCAVAAGLALVQNFSPSYIHVMVIAVFVLLAWSGIKYLDYIEIGAAWRAVTSRRVLRDVRDEIYLRDLNRSMLSAESAEGCWTIVRKVCAEMQFDGVEMMLHEVHFEDGSTDAESTSWLITLPLGDRGYLKLCRCGHETPARLMMSAVERLQEDLTKKAVALATEPYIINRPVRSAVLGQQDRSGAA
jgi:UDP-GlcNAc:undecaprenyl-phosphate GlcNAc-1-phosphate transferase